MGRVHIVYISIVASAFFDQVDVFLFSVFGGFGGDDPGLLASFDVLVLGLAFRLFHYLFCTVFYGVWRVFYDGFCLFLRLLGFGGFVLADYVGSFLFLLRDDFSGVLDYACADG